MRSHKTTSLAISGRYRANDVARSIKTLKAPRIFVSAQRNSLQLNDRHAHPMRPTLGSTDGPQDSIISQWEF